MNSSAQTNSQESPLVIEPCHSNNREPLRVCVRDALENYFSTLNGHSIDGLYQMVLDEVEQPLLEAVLKHTRSNQTRAAQILGISRSTLRKKLAKYGLD